MFSMPLIRTTHEQRLSLPEQQRHGISISGGHKKSPGGFLDRGLTSQGEEKYSWVADKRWKDPNWISLEYQFLFPPLVPPVRRAASERRGNILPAPKCLGKSMLCVPPHNMVGGNTAKPDWTCASRAWDMYPP